MAFEDVKAEIGLLLSRMTDQPADARELSLMLLQRLNELKAFGMPLPEDLVDLENALQAEFAADLRKGQPDTGPTGDR